MTLKLKERLMSELQRLGLAAELETDYLGDFCQLTTKSSGKSVVACIDCLANSYLPSQRSTATPEEVVESLLEMGGPMSFEKFPLGAFIFELEQAIDSDNSKQALRLVDQIIVRGACIRTIDSEEIETGIPVTYLFIDGEPVATWRRPKEDKTLDASDGIESHWPASKALIQVLAHIDEFYRPQDDEDVDYKGEFLVRCDDAPPLSLPVSGHRTLEGALRAAARRTALDPASSYSVTSWDELGRENSHYLLADELTTDA